jgi:endoplasmic reticulum junction formation protein lunapark
MALEGRLGYTCEESTLTWPVQSDTTSPASFEKALSKLSTQINSANLALDTTRSRARRSKALWTLYTTLGYLMFMIVEVLVIKPHNWSWPQYAGVIGIPLLVYGVRQLIALFFDWRIGRQQSYVDSLQKQRETKIADLKKATKYDSTQELLQKYGGAPPKQKEAKDLKQGTKRKVAQPQSPPQRTGLPPPPTANIPGRAPPQITPQRPELRPMPDTETPISPQMLSQRPVAFSPDEPDFAPNAFNIPPPTAPPAYEAGPSFLNRLLDILIGEDETAAKNRMALICSNCRLVNGQAPPGIRTPEELGKWRCSGCGAWSGVENEAVIAVSQATQQATIDPNEDWEKVPSKSDDEEVMDQEADPEVDSPTPGTTGRDVGDNSSVSRRVTRSVRAEEPLEALE